MLVICVLSNAQELFVSLPGVQCFCFWPSKLSTLIVIVRENGMAAVLQKLVLDLQIQSLDTEENSVPVLLKL